MRTAIEDGLRAIRQVLTAKRLDLARAQQATGERPEADRTCPGGREPLPGPDPRPRHLPPSRPWPRGRGSRSLPSPPAVAVIMDTGGRLHIRSEPAAEAVPPTPAAAPGAAAATAGAAAWAEAAAAAATAGHWREDQVGLLLAMKSDVADAAPGSEIPAAFLAVGRIPKLVRELKKQPKAGADAVTDAAAAEAAGEALQAEATYEPSVGPRRQVVASRPNGPVFAPRGTPAAWALGFDGAAWQAFVADDAASNWRRQRRFFESCGPIRDFIHALS